MSAYRTQQINDFEKKTPLQWPSASNARLAPMPCHILPTYCILCPDTASNATQQHMSDKHWMLNSQHPHASANLKTISSLGVFPVPAMLLTAQRNEYTKREGLQFLPRIHKDEGS